LAIGRQTDLNVELNEEKWSEAPIGYAPVHSQWSNGTLVRHGRCAKKVDNNCSFVHQRTLRKVENWISRRNVHLSLIMDKGREVVSARVKMLPHQVELAVNFMMVADSIETETQNYKQSPQQDCWNHLHPDNGWKRG
jgi:hypothetical protein